MFGTHNIEIDEVLDTYSSLSKSNTETYEELDEPIFKLTSAEWFSCTRYNPDTIESIKAAIGGVETEVVKVFHMLLPKLGDGFQHQLMKQGWCCQDWMLKT